MNLLRQIKEALIGALTVPPAVVTTMEGDVPKPDVASLPITLITTGTPPRVGSGAAEATNTGGVVSIRKVPVPVPVLPAWSLAVAVTVAMPSGPLTV